MTNVLEAFWISISLFGVNFRHLMKNISKNAQTVQKNPVFEKHIAKNYYNCLQHERVLKIFLL
jgi:hypothetical protein